VGRGTNIGATKRNKNGVGEDHSTRTWVPVNVETHTTTKKDGTEDRVCRCLHARM